MTWMHYQPCVPYTDHYDLLAWVRDENNADYQPPTINEMQDASLYWEVGGQLFSCPGNAVYVAEGDPSKVRRCFIIVEDAGPTSKMQALHPPNWLDRPAKA